MLTLALAACGGGGDDADTGAAQAPPAAADGAALPSRYAVYTYGEGLLTADAGTVNQGVLALGAGVSTQLSRVGSDGGVAARNANFQVVSRLDGAVLMLCDPAGFQGDADPTRHVAIGLQGGLAQAVQVTRASELIGLSFHRLRGCSLVDASDAPQGRADNPDTQTKRYTVQADGSLVSSGGGTLTAAQLRDIVAGGPINLGEGTDWLTFYRFTVQGQTRHFAVSRFRPGFDAAGPHELALWLPQ